MARPNVFLDITIGGKAAGRIVMELYSDIASGGTAAGVSNTAVAPIERVKLLLQVQDAFKTITADKRFEGIMDVFMRVPTEHGHQILPKPGPELRFQGYLQSNLPRGTWQKEGFLEVSSSPETWHPEELLEPPLSASSTHLTSPVPVLPLEKSNNGEFKGLAHCLVKIVKSDGPIGLYRGFFVSVQGIIIYRAAYFGIIYTAKMIFAADGQKLNFFAVWRIAQVVTVGSGILSYPWDTVRRRMMMQFGRKDILYKNIPNCAKKIIVNEGMSAIFKGTGGALVLAIYDEIQKFV